MRESRGLQTLDEGESHGGELGVIFRPAESGGTLIRTNATREFYGIRSTPISGLENETLVGEQMEMGDKEPRH